MSATRVVNLQDLSDWLAHAARSARRFLQASAFGQTRRWAPPGSDSAREGLDPTYSDRAGLAELRGEALRALEAAILVLALGPVLLSVVDVSSRRPELWLIVFGLGLAVLGSRKLKPFSLPLASIVLAVGLAGSLLLAIDLYPDSHLVYLLPLVVTASALVAGLWLSIGSAAALTALALASQENLAGPLWGGVAGTVVFLIWITVLLCWLMTRPIQTALDWSWQSYVRALEKTEEARDRQGELGRLSKSLAETCVRLEHANVELERARRAAEEARRLKAEFAATISHELRTPLNLIIGFSEMMMNARHTYSGEVLPESYRSDVETIYRNACHISNLIDDVLDLSRIEAHRMALQREKADLAPVVEEAVTTVASLARELGLELTTAIQERLPTLNIDRTRVKQIIINLLNNAIRSTEVGGIAVQAEGRNGEVVISVSDTGAGIAPDDIPGLFQDYSQIGGPARKGRSGLGLAVSKQFAELHGGTMWAESVRGQGSTFYVSLPLQENVVASPFASLPEPSSAATVSAHAPTVAILGDDAEAAKLFRRYLDRYQVICAGGAEIEALVDGDANPHAVVLTDESAVRAWSGVLATRAEARRAPALTCLLSTTRQRAEELGVTDYLVKPITREQLRAALERTGRAKGLRKLLVVEDDLEMGRLLAKMVRSLSRRCQVWTASDGAEGLRLAREQQPDLILLDLLMPEVDGYAVLEAMREDPDLERVPVVVITARERKEEPVLADSLGIARPGGLAVGEVMRCAKAALDCLLEAPARDTAPAPPEVPAG